MAMGELYMVMMWKVRTIKGYSETIKDMDLDHYFILKERLKKGSGKMMNFKSLKNMTQKKSKQKTKCLNKKYFLYLNLKSKS